MHVYRVRHKQTGLFYQPKKGRFDNITNLGPNGKVYYGRKPIFEFFEYITLGKNQIEKFNVKINDWRVCRTKREDWEIIEYNLDEGTVT